MTKRPLSTLVLPDSFASVAPNWTKKKVKVMIYIFLKRLFIAILLMSIYLLTFTKIGNILLEEF